MRSSDAVGDLWCSPTCRHNSEPPLWLLGNCYQLPFFRVFLFSAQWGTNMAPPNMIHVENGVKRAKRSATKMHASKNSNKYQQVQRMPRPTSDRPPKCAFQGAAEGAAGKASSSPVARPSSAHLANARRHWKTGKGKQSETPHDPFGIGCSEELWDTLLFISIYPWTTLLFIICISPGR